MHSGPLTEQGASSCVVTYRRVRGGPGYEGVARQGHGDTLAAQVGDADSRLPIGCWIRLCVSSPETILADLRGERNRELAFFEGRTVFANPATRSRGVAEEIL